MNYIEGHVTAQCRNLCAKIYISLPLELREMVYRFLFSCAEEVVVDYHHLNLESATQEPKSPPSFLVCHGRQTYAHVFNPKSTGEAVRAKLVRIWYRPVTLRFVARQHGPLRDMHAYISRCFEQDYLDTRHKVPDLFESAELMLP